MMKLMKMNSYFTFDKIMTGNNNLFDVLSDDTNYPNVHDFINANTKEVMNIDYFLSHSSEKYLSRFVQTFIDNNKTYSEVVVYLARIIYLKFATKWNKIYSALNTEYNPLENYSMEEERTPDLTHESTTNVKSNVVTSRSASSEAKVNAFNSQDATPTNESEGSESVTTSGDADDNETHSVNTETGTETLTRSGNIGVTTSQQMLESEFKVREYNFYKMIYNDIDSLLCLSTY